MIRLWKHLPCISVLRSALFSRSRHALLIGFAALLAVRGTVAAEYWQLRSGDATVVVEGDRKFAEVAIRRVFLVQSTARRLLDWPQDFRPAPVLALMIDERRIRSVFEAGPLEVGAYTLTTPALTVVASPLVPLNRREFEQFQQAYGKALLMEPPTARWGECAHVGFAMMFSAAEYTNQAHLFLDAGRVLPPPTIFLPNRFLDDPQLFTTEVERQERGYSCYMLDMMFVAGDATRRSGIKKLFVALANGTPAAAAVPAELGGTLPRFSALFARFVPMRVYEMRKLDVKADLPLPDPLVTAAEELTRERVDGLLKIVCSKVAKCREAGGTPSH